MFGLFKALLEGFKPRINTPRAEWDRRTTYIAKKCPRIVSQMRQTWFPIITESSLYTNYKKNSGIQMSAESCNIILALQTASSIYFIKSTGYVLESEGEYFFDHFFTKMYGDKKYSDCAYLPEFLSLREGEGLFVRFSELFTESLFPDDFTLQAVAHPVFKLAGNDIYFLTLKVVAEAFNDIRNVNSISIQRGKFVQRVDQIVRMLKNP